ncbi:MAG: sigma-54 dependent transcriptional regulator, partial [Fibrobacterota bacterium]
MPKDDIVLRELQARIPSLKDFIRKSWDIVIRLDEKGRVCAIGGQENIEPFNQNLILNKEIDELYDMPKTGRPADWVTDLLAKKEFTLDDLIHSDKAFRSKNVFENTEIGYGFYSDIPASILYLSNLAGIGLFGIIRFRELAKTVSLLNREPFIMVDKNENLRGFNAKFLAYFPDNASSPHKILGRPIGEWVCPNPLALIRNTGTASDKIRSQQWRPLFSATPAAFQNLVTPFFPDRKNLTFSSSGAVWTPTIEDDRGLLELAPRIDTTQFDYKFILELLVENGPLPSFIINGDSADSYLFPDFQGYLTGFDPITHLFRIKKQGEMAHEALSPETVPPGRYSLEIIKKGPSFFLFLNDQLKLTFHDTAPIEKQTGIQYLYASVNGPIRIMAMQGYTLPREEMAEDPEVSFVNPAPNFLQFHQVLDNRVVNFKGEFFYALHFYDITPLRQALLSLEKQRAQIMQDRDRFKSLLKKEQPSAPVIIGASAVMQQLIEKARIASQSSASVLLQGETGTGKGLLAEFIHRNSLYQNGPFVKVDCAELPESLLESELFGHEKGAFTGAIQSRVGKLEAAHSGTLFLDEIGNLTLSIQAKLLHFLQDFTLVRLGSNQEIKVATRIIAASNRDLKQLVEKGLFRADLFYRLDAVSLDLPPLRERKEDIPDLCISLLKNYNRKFNRSVKKLTPAAFQRLMAHDWPGNIRELENVIQKAVIYSDKDTLAPENLEIPEQKKAFHKKQAPLKIPTRNPRALRREHCIELLEKNNGIIRWAAREAKVS